MVTLPGNMLSQEDAGNAGNVSLTIAQADMSGIDEETRNLIGDRPVIQLSLKVDGEPYAWSNENAPVTVSIPYTPTQQNWTTPSISPYGILTAAGNVVSFPTAGMTLPPEQ